VSQAENELCEVRSVRRTIPEAKRSGIRHSLRASEVPLEALVELSQERSDEAIFLSFP